MPQYFTTIKTEDTNNDDAVRIHNRKLNNYIKYGWDGVDVPRETIEGGELEGRNVKDHSTSTTVKNFNYVICTTLCCDDDHNRY